MKKSISSGQVELLNKVSGIGPKTAQRVVAGLKDKLEVEEPAEGWGSGFSDALEALVGLGYSSVQARQALAKCPVEEPGEKVKQALKILAGKK